MFCKHQWKILSEKETQSKMEFMMKQCGEAPAPRNRLDLEPLLGRKLIQLLTCTKCGRLKRFVTEF